MEQKIDARELIHKLIHVSRLHRRTIERWADDAGMHCSEHRMLMHISRCHRIPSQKDLAERLKISPAAVANTLKKLEADGYISREKRSDCADGRYNEIVITEQGRIAINSSEKYFKTVDDDALRGLGDEEKQMLFSLLDRIEANLTEADRDACSLPCTDIERKCTTK